MDLSNLGTIIRERREVLGLTQSRLAQLSGLSRQTLVGLEAGALSDRALGNQSSGASRTFVVADASGRVMGYYALAAGAVAHETAASAVRRNMPDPVPALVLGRLAVDRQAQGIKLGASLLQDAVKRAIGVSADAGIRALLVHALSEPAKQFHLHYGFQASTLHPMTLMMRLPHP